ncbi:hypothetical protein LZ30DRAFT_795093 [Colletotrichum cereale]|nr:hypothetical protein LZ30DRAFT_795093 [Colletotrichum cereale]
MAVIGTPQVELCRSKAEIPGFCYAWLWHTLELAPTYDYFVEGICGSVRARTGHGNESVDIPFAKDTNTVKFCVDKCAVPVSIPLSGTLSWPSNIFIQVAATCTSVQERSLSCTDFSRHGYHAHMRRSEHRLSIVKYDAETNNGEQSRWGSLPRPHMVQDVTTKELSRTSSNHSDVDAV